jgi:hypothetical protein
MNWFTTRITTVGVSNDVQKLITEKSLRLLTLPKSDFDVIIPVSWFELYRVLKRDITSRHSAPEGPLRVVMNVSLIYEEKGEKVIIYVNTYN